MIEFTKDTGEIVVRHLMDSYTVKDIKDILEKCEDDDEVLICCEVASGGDYQLFPTKSKGSVYKTGDLLIIDVNDRED